MADDKTLPVEREYRKTATIRARQWWQMGDHPAVVLKSDPNRYADEGVPWINTLEGGHIVTPGDWIATGVQGEHRPIKPDVFTATYTPVDSLAITPADPRASEAGEVGDDTAASWLYESVCPRAGGWSRCSPENKDSWRERAATVAALATRSAEPTNVEAAASMALMYLETGFVECERCGNEVPTATLDAVYELRDAGVASAEDVASPLSSTPVGESA